MFGVYADKEYVLKKLNMDPNLKDSELNGELYRRSFERKDRKTPNPVWFDEFRAKDL